jgi:5,10-methylenetetrahydromethanopterin reductase
MTAAGDLPAGPARVSLRINNDLSPADFVDLAVTAEAAGFDQLWVSHDLFWRSAPVLLAAAAGATSRIGLGVGIMNPYSSHPAELAMHAATLAELSGGRFLLGVASGAEEFLAWAGIDRPRPLAGARDAMVACRALLERRVPADDPAVAASGASWTAEGRLRWPGPPVPIYLGAMSPRMLALGGELADGVLALSFPPEQFSVAAGTVRAGARAAGRDPDALDQPACFWCSVDDDRERAEAALAEKLAYYGPSFSPSLIAPAGVTPADFEPAAAALQRGDHAAARALISPTMLTLGVAGDPPAIAARCRALLAAGAQHLSFGPPLGSNPLAAVERLGAEVLPALRSGAGLASSPPARPLPPTPVA